MAQITTYKISLRDYCLDSKYILKTKRAVINSPESTRALSAGCKRSQPRIRLLSRLSNVLGTRTANKWRTFLRSRTDILIGITPFQWECSTSLPLFGPKSAALMRCILFLAGHLEQLALSGLIKNEPCCQFLL